MIYGAKETVKKRTGTTAEALGIAQKEYDDLLDKLLEQASRGVDDYCGRIFYKETDFTEYLRGNGRRVISVRHYPIISISEIKTGDDVVDTDKYRIVEKGPPFGNSGRIRRTNGGYWYNQEHEINYDYGFDTTPKPINKIVEGMVVRVVNEANAEVKASGADSVSMDGYSITFGTVKAEDLIRLTEAQEKKLDRYRKPAVA